MSKNNKKKESFNLIVDDLVENFRMLYSDQEAYYESRGKPVATVKRRNNNGILTSMLVERSELKKTLNTAKYEYMDMLKDLKKLYSKSLINKHITTNVPMLISDNLKQFYLEFIANDSILKNNLETFEMLQRNLIYSATALGLFSVYTRHRNLSHPDNRQFIKADQLMNKHFAKTFDKLKSKGETLDKKGKLMAAQTADRFRLTSFRTIIADESIKKANWTKDDHEKITEQVRKQMDIEHSIIKSLVESYRVSPSTNTLTNTSECESNQLE
jgi:hypothetical protein